MFNLQQNLMNKILPIIYNKEIDLLKKVLLSKQVVHKMDTYKIINNDRLFKTKL
jgi:hypothetical protein